MVSAELKPTTSPSANPWEAQTHRYTMLHVRLQLVLRAVLAAKPASVFEFGCGVGVLRAELLRRIPGLVYHGCDVSQSAVDALADPNVVRVDLNAEPVPFAGMTFDCVVGSGIFEYVADVPKTFAEVRARMRPGGTFVVSYFNMRHLYRRYVRMRGGQPFRHPTWVNDYSLAEFRRVLEDAGFRLRDEIPSNLGLRGSPSIGQERWRAGPLLALRRIPGIQNIAHQVVFVAEAAASPREPART